MCVAVCAITNGGDAFSVTTSPVTAANSAVGISVDIPPAAAGGQAVPTATCLYDFLLIASGRDANGVQADRYCGNELNPVVGAAGAGAATSIPVCSKLISLCTWSYS